MTIEIIISRYNTIQWTKPFKRQIVKMVSCDVGSEARMCDVRVFVCIGDRLDRHIINTAKTKVMKIKTDVNQSIVIGIDDVETVDSFTYLGSVMDADKGSTADISPRLKKARAAYYKLRKVRASSQYRRKTKLRIYKSNVMSVLLYGAECWKVNQNDGQRLNTFHNRCLRRILRIFWPTTISNEKLYEEVEISRITDIIKARRWSFIGHVLRFENTNDCRIVMNWTPVGKRSIRRPKETWRRMVEKDEMHLGGNHGQRWYRGRLTGRNGGLLYMPYATHGAQGIHKP